MSKLKQAHGRYEILLQWSERLRQDALMLEHAKVENEGIKRALAALRIELGEHLHLLAHAIRKQERRARAHDQPTCAEGT